MSYHNMNGPYLMVISDGVKKNASDVFNILDSDEGGAKTFSVALRLKSDPTKLFWGAYSMLEDRTHVALTAYTTQQFKAYVDAMQIEKGRAAVGSVTAFKGNVQVSDAGVDPWAQIDTWGYEPVPNSVN